MRRARPQGGEGRGRPKQRRGAKGKPGLTLPLGGKHRTPQRRPNARGRGKEETKEGKGKDGWSGWKDSDRPTTRTTNPRLQGDLLRGVPENDRY